MINTKIILTGTGLMDNDQPNFEISVMATVNTSAKDARRQAIHWVVSEVGNMLTVGPPSLIIGQQTVWRLPVILTSSTIGTVGEVGIVDVDTKTGKVLTDDKIRTQIIENVKHLTRSTSTTNR